mmetsp:Transcript_30703/g.77029  ORF Transcript_30703/g.77029 Transcript_30703/m.77029 type:complete len:348 (-) Transcript_30703:71-1114(-)
MAAVVVDEPYASSSSGSIASETVHRVLTTYGFVQAYTVGDVQQDTVLLTYHDIGLDHTSCFAAFLQHPGIRAALGHFAVLHIDAPGQEENATPLSNDSSFVTCQQMAEQVIEVCRTLRVSRVVGLGLGLGGNILLRAALLAPSLVSGLILVGPTAQSSGWAEWIYQGIGTYTLSWFGITTRVLDQLCARYLPDTALQEHPDRYAELRHTIASKQPINLMKFIQANSHKTPIEDQLSKVRCPSILFVGEYSYYGDDTLLVFSKLRPELSELVQLRSHAHLLTDEAPHHMSQPLALFVAGLNLSTAHKQAPICKDPVAEMMATLEKEDQESLVQAAPATATTSGAGVGL